MELKEIGEFGFIDRIGRGCIVHPTDVIKGIGDDAAAFRPPSGEVMLTTTDLMVERVHFNRDRISGFQLGYKTLAVNLSDIAAMGGTARHAFVSIAIPADCGIAYLDDLYNGMKHLAAAHQVNLLGGDTTLAKIDLVINVCVIGSVPASQMLTRDGAKPEDVLYTTGCLGDSRAGLKLLLENAAPTTDGERALIRAHLEPKAYLREGRFLAMQQAVHAAIDISDGLSADLTHILKQSRVGARLEADKVPISMQLRDFCRRFEYDPTDFALAGGEDYTLLVAVDPKKSGLLETAYENRFGISLRRIGVVTRTKGLILMDASGREKKVTPAGWDHFR